MPYPTMPLPSTPVARPYSPVAMPADLASMHRQTDDEEVRRPTSRSPISLPPSPRPTLRSPWSEAAATPSSSRISSSSSSSMAADNTQRHWASGPLAIAYVGDHYHVYQVHLDLARSRCHMFNDDDPLEVYLPGVSPAAFELCLEYLYTEKIRTIKRDNETEADDSHIFVEAYLLGVRFLFEAFQNAVADQIARYWEARPPSFAAFKMFLDAAPKLVCYTDPLRMFALDKVTTLFLREDPNQNERVEVRKLRQLIEAGGSNAWEMFDAVRDRVIDNHWPDRSPDDFCWAFHIHVHTPECGTQEEQAARARMRKWVGSNY